LGIARDRRMLNLDSNMMPIEECSRMNLCKGSGSSREWIKRQKEIPYGITAKVTLNGLMDVGDGSDGTVILECFEGVRVLHRQKVSESRKVLTQFDVNATIQPAQVDQTFSGPKQTQIRRENYEERHRYNI
jgi:hypothetical protein